MNKAKYPFSPSAILFVLYYILVPVFLAAFDLPFIGSLFKAGSLVYLGLGIVLFFRSAGLPVAVFTLVGAALQISPTVYFVVRLFSGAATLSTVLSLLNSLCQASALGVLTVFAVGMAFSEKNTSLIKKLWFVPVICSGLSLLIYIADRLWLSSLASETNYLLFTFDILLAFVSSLATALLGVWYKRLSALKQ